MSHLPPSRFFPPAEIAGPDGLLALGGRLTPQWLLDAYRHGILPWPQSDDENLIPWCSPDPRAIIELDRFHVPRRLARTCRSGRFEVTLDRDFAGVIRGCATADGRVGQTWLTGRMIRAYSRMFELGHVHSVEVWHYGQLAGGLYGVAIGGLFSAEPCSTVSAMPRRWPWSIWSQILKARGYLLLDISNSLATAQLG